MYFLQAVPPEQVPHMAKHDQDTIADVGDDGGYQGRLLKALKKFIPPVLFLKETTQAIPVRLQQKNEDVQG